MDRVWSSIVTGRTEFIDINDYTATVTVKTQGKMIKIVTK